MAPSVNPKPVNLALQGGGAHGAVTWGVIDRILEDDRIDIDSISGTSAGAVNAAALAYGLHLNGRDGGREMLEKIWRTISEFGAFLSPVRRSPMAQFFQEYNLDASITYQAFEMFTRTLSPYQFNPLDLNPLRDVLEKCIDFDALQCCTATNLYVSATNVRTGKVHVFRTKEITLNTILASACLPFIFRAVEIEGEHYWDGGYMGNPVLFPFFYEADTSDVLIVHVNPIERDDVPKTPPEISNRINEISFNSSLMREMRAISFVHKLLDEGWIKDEYRERLRNVRIHSIRSDQTLVDLSVASKFNVEWDFLCELRDRGRRIADEWLNANCEEIGVNSTVDLRAMVDPSDS
ncbi:MAG: patatin-like phospholipase family protein [Pseudomonadota bacterium]